MRPEAFVVEPGDAVPPRFANQIPGNPEKGFSPLEIPASKEIAKIGFLKRKEAWSTRRGLESLSYLLSDDVDNLFLSFYRLVPKQPLSKAYSEHKTKYLTALKDHWRNRKEAHNAVEHLAKRQKGMVAALHPDAWYAPHEPLSLTTDARVIAGLGYKGALEVGLTLHPLYGFPYLPGTALKGIARAWAELCLLPQQKVSKEQIKAVFGSEDKDEKNNTEKQVGGVVFFDALPVTFPVLDLDVMTPHFTPYYQKNKVPGDWHDPVPVTFLTIAAGTEFKFQLAVSLRLGMDRVEAAEMAALAVSWLKAGLEDLGAGGKTAAGYGFFTDEEVQNDTQNVQSPVTKPQPKPRVDPAAEPKLATVGKNTTGIPARVTGKRAKVLLVRLHAIGYEEKDFELGGVNAEDFAEGDWVYVDVAGYSTRRRKATQITYRSRL